MKAFKKLKFSSFIKKEFLLLYLIILIGSYIRLAGVFTNSFAFTYDVGRDMLALWNIAYLHKLTLIGATTGLPGVFYGPWWYYMLTPFFIIFGGNPQGLDFIMALTGIASIVLAYVFGRKIQGSLTGLIFAGLIGASPVMVSLSAQIWNPNIAPFFVLLIFLMLRKIFSGEKNRRLLYFFLLGIFLSLSIDIEIVYGILFTLGIFISLGLILRNKIKLKEVVSLAFGLLVIASPRILFELRHHFLMSKSFIKFVTSGGTSHTASSLISDFINRLSFMFSQFSSTVALNNEILGLIFLFFIALTLFLFYKKENIITKDFINLSLIVIATFIVGTTFFSHDIWPHYLVGLPVIYIFLISVSFYMLGKQIKNKYVVPIAVFILILVNFNPVAIFQSLTQPLWIGDASVYRNQLAVINYVYKQANGRSFKYVVYTPPVYDYTYQYLFMWYGENAFHYEPSQQSHLAFFILEPDLQMPSRLTDWLRERQGDGTIIKSEKLPSGIIVQTRVH